jgi:phosphomannomutase/phosphoglucomutase
MVLMNYVNQKPRQLFGTNGIRGVVNETLGSEFAAEIGMAIGTFCRGKNTVIGTDGRTSNEMLKLAVTSGIISTGSSVLDIGIAPTPVVQFAVPNLGCRLGVTITASHNPPEFNGIKCSDRDGAELMREDEERIERIYYSKKYARAGWSALGSLRRENIIPQYIQKLCSLIDLGLTGRAGLKVVLDCGNGTAGLVTPFILKRLGCNVITLNAHVDGMFPAHPSEPTEENAAQLKESVVGLKADLGIIQDGDGDRTIFVDEKGNFVPGERSLAIIASHITRERKGGTVVTPVNSSMCIEEVVRKNGGRVVYTRVGSPSVIKGMKDTGAVFGGEEAGGLVHPEFQYAKDGMMTAARMVEILAKRGKSLSELDSEIPLYHVGKVRIRCPDEIKQKVLGQFRKSMEKRGCKADTTDGVKLWTKDGWVLVRPSGTEPIFRIFAERRGKKESDDAVKEYVAELEQLIRKS